MKLKKSLITLAMTAAVMAGGSVPAYAVMAKQGPVQYEMPDGSFVEIRLYGDESHSYATTADGYVVKADGDNVLRYMVPRDGKLVMSTVKVTNVADRTPEAVNLLNGYDRAEALKILNAERQGVEGSFKMQSVISRAGTNEKIANFPTLGQQKILVILVEYSDVKFTTADAHTAFNNLMNQEGYSANDATGSAYDFFTASSNGQFQPQFDVYGPVTLNNTRAYYGAHSGNKNDVRAAEMIRDACKLLDDEIDFSQYDADNDGEVDNVYVFYAGNGEADSGIEESIWPHAWYVYNGGGLYLRCDGKLINHYACSAELNRVYTSNVFTGIGTFCHEFSHVMGLPDLYATDYSNSFTPGEWTLMDQGSYNNNQRTPPTHSAYERFVFGWLTPEVLEDAANVTVKPIGVDYNSAYRITTNRTNEYYIIENRQQTGWDRYIPGHGMLVWHIDYNSSVWRYNTVNNTPTHQRIDIVEADGTQTSGSRAGDSFPGTAKVTEFTDDTTPSMKTWAGVALDKPLTDIRESAGTVYFLFKGGVVDEEGSEISLLAPTNLTPVSATLNWSAANGVSEYFVTVVAPDGTKLLNREKVSGTSCNLSGLSFETKYDYSVSYRSGDFYAGKSGSFETPFGTVDYHVVNALDASAVTGNSFTANWEALRGAESYSVTVYNSQPIPSESSMADFTDKAFAEGWSSNSKSWATIDGYYGNSAPSLALMSDGNYVESPLMSLPIETLTFGIRGRQNGNSTLDICVPDGEGGWTVVESIKPVTTAWRNYTFDQSILGDNVYQIRLVHNKGSMSNIVVDDVKVVTIEGVNYLPMAGKTDVPVGNATSLVVNGLETGTRYFYSVKAHQGNLVSRESARIEVTTSGTVGIDDVDADADGCRIVGGMLEVTTSDAAMVEIYTVSGMLIMRDLKDAGTSSYLLNASGIYVVKVGNKAYKFVK